MVIDLSVTAEGPTSRSCVVLKSGFNLDLVRVFHDTLWKLFSLLNYKYFENPEFLDLGVKIIGYFPVLVFKFY